MSDDKYRLIFEGEDSDLVRKIDDTTNKLNKQRDLVMKFNKERSAIARADRKDAFNSLSIEEKRVKLTSKQLELERHLTRARAQGNGVRMSALQLSMARNSAAIRGLGASGGGASGTGAVAGYGILRAGLAEIIGASIAGAARSALHFADEMSDLAEQLGVTRKEIIEITRAAGYAGASSKQIVGNLSTLSATRSAALGGDERSKALFSKYGIDPTQGNTIELAQKIANSLGPAGMTSADRGAMGQFFGRRPEAMIATLRNVQDVDGGLDSKIDRLDQANTRIEKFWNSMKELNAAAFAGVLQAHDFIIAKGSELRSKYPTLSKMFPTAVGYLAAMGEGNNGPTSMADKRRLDDTVLRPNVGGIVSQSTFRSPVAQADSLARMGIYIGGGPNAAQTIMRQQLTELKLIKEAARENNKVMVREL